MAAALTNGAKPANLPNQTLYIANLNTKIQKDDLRRSLYCLFSTYGPVLDVVALKTPAMRGQAHVVFRDAQTSSQAMRALQGFDFLGKELRIEYGKGKSNVISRLDGSVRGPEPKPAAPPPSVPEAAKSVFSNPNAALPSTASSLPPKPSAGSSLPVPGQAAAAQDGSKSPIGVKRPRDEDSDEDVEMEVDSDDEQSMDESDG